MLKSRHQKMLWVLGGVLALGVIVALVLNALNQNIALYLSPTQVAAGALPQGKPFRVGGLVKPGSLRREEDGVSVRFVVTDMEQELAVVYRGILPDLFKEGKGVVVQGRLLEGRLVASEVLAKHDENYMPPAAAAALAEAEARKLKQAEGKSPVAYPHEGKAPPSEGVARINGRAAAPPLPASATASQPASVQP